jgi:hypothetical protein
MPHLKPLTHVSPMCALNACRQPVCAKAYAVACLGAHALPADMHVCGCKHLHIRACRLRALLPATEAVCLPHVPGARMRLPGARSGPVPGVLCQHALLLLLSKHPWHMWQATPPACRQAHTPCGHPQPTSTAASLLASAAHDSLLAVACEPPYLRLLACERDALY